MIRVAIVTGSRGLDNPLPIWKQLDNFDPHIVIHGACSSGADSYANGWLIRQECKDLPHVIEVAIPARWNAHGKSAGPIRNRDMADKAKRLMADGAEVMCFAFPVGASRGTRNCIEEMRKRGVPVNVFEVEENKP